MSCSRSCSRSSILGSCHSSCSSCSSNCSCCSSQQMIIICKLHFRLLSVVLLPLTDLSFDPISSIIALQDLSHTRSFIICLLGQVKTYLIGINLYQQTKSPSRLKQGHTSSLKPISTSKASKNSTASKCDIFRQTRKQRGRTRGFSTNQSEMTHRKEHMSDSPLPQMNDLSKITIEISHKIYKKQRSRSQLFLKKNCNQGNQARGAQSRQACCFWVHERPNYNQMGSCMEKRADRKSEPINNNQKTLPSEQIILPEAFKTQEAMPPGQQQTNILIPEPPKLDVCGSNSTINIRESYQVKVEEIATTNKVNQSPPIDSKLSLSFSNRLPSIDSNILRTSGQTNRDSLAHIDPQHHRCFVRKASNLENSQLMQQLQNTQNIGQLMNSDLALRETGRSKGSSCPS